MGNKTLYLPLTEKWYKMIEAGIKKEEYREIKPYWSKRLDGKQYDQVVFSYGYTKRRMTFKVSRIFEGLGVKEWGAPDKPVYVIQLGKRLENGQ